MTHQEYKEIMPLAALSVLERDELQALQTHLAGCSECARELDQWEATASALAYEAAPTAPSPDLRDRVLAAVRADGPGLHDNVVQFPKHSTADSNNFFKFGAIAAVILLLALLAGVIMLWRQNQSAQSEIARLSEQIGTTQQSLEVERNALSAITRPGVRINELAGTKEAPNARAILAFDPKTGRAVLVANGLPVAPPDKAYQLWFMVGSRPVPGKVFRVDASGSARADEQVPPEALNSTVFAVTLEPKDGVPKPTGSMYLLTPADHSTLYSDPMLRTVFIC